MADTPLPAPKNTAVEIIGSVLSALIDGLGVDIAMGILVSRVPFLGLPIIRDIVKAIIGKFAATIDAQAFDFFAKFAIRLQNDARKLAYDKAIVAMNSPGATDEDVQSAKEAMDRLINRNRF